MTGLIEPVVMPKWGLAMSEGTVVAWMTEAGDVIEKGADLVEIETTKIANVLESPVAGTLRRMVASAGETLPVGALLGVIADNSVSDADIDAFVDSFVAEAPDDEEVAAAEPRTIDVGGHRIRYLQQGGGDATPIVLIHGFGGDLNTWMFVQGDLALDRATYALDLPGHGGSSKRIDDGSVGGLAKVVGATLDALGVERAHLVGHSLGAAVALAIGLDQAHRVASLSLIAPAGFGPQINGRFITGFIEASRRKDMKPVLEDLVADPSLVSRDMIEDVLRFKRLDGAIDALQAIANAAFPRGRQADILVDRLGELGAPALVIWGEADAILPITQIADAEGTTATHRLPNIGHMPHMEAASEVLSLITAHISACEGT